MKRHIMSQDSPHFDWGLVERLATIALPLAEPLMNEMGAGGALGVRPGIV